MNAGVLRLLLTGLILRWLASGIHALPATWILLPILSVSNTSLVAGYDCQPTYTSAPCAGHGDCYLLLESTDPASDLYVQSATQSPIAVNTSMLDLAKLGSNTLLPAAVCLCHDGYTGNVDYVDHHALDGDSCAVYQPTLNKLAAVGCALFSLLLLLALVRLYGWHAWHRSTIILTAAFGVLPGSSQATPLETARVLPPSEQAGLQPPLGAAVVSIQQAGRRVGARNAGGLLSEGHADLGRRTRSRFFRHLLHESFVYPACTVAMSICSLLYFVLRIATPLTIGDSWVMSATIYVQHVSYNVASCLGVYSTLQLAAGVARLKRVNGVDIVVITQRCLIGLCLYQTMSWTVAAFLLLPAVAHHIQLAVQLFLLFCFFPDFLLGPITVLVVRRITHALSTNLNTLPAQQQQQRRLVQLKLTRTAIVVTILTAGNSSVCLWLVADGRLRQSVLPYYAFVWHYSVFTLFCIRMLYVKPPRPIATVYPVTHPVHHKQHGSAKNSHKSSGAATAESATPCTSWQPGHVRQKSLGGLHSTSSHGSSSSGQIAVSSRQQKAVEMSASVGAGGDGETEAANGTIVEEQLSTTTNIVAR